MRLMSMTELLIFGHLSNKGVSNRKTLLAEGCSNTKQSVKHHLDKLVSEGYVKRERVRYASGYQYSLTKSGRDRARELGAAGLEFFQGVCNSLEQTPF